MSLIFDISIAVILILFIVFGLFTKNIIRTAINFILFIILFFVFSSLTNVILSIEPVKEGINQGITALTDSLDGFMNQLKDLNAQNNLNLPILDSVYLSKPYLEAASEGLVNLALCLVSPILALILAYPLAWAIYAPIKAVLKKKTNYYSPNTLTKWILKGSSSALNLLFGFFFVSFIVSPLGTAKGALNKTNDFVATINLTEILGEASSEIETIKGRIDGFDQEFLTFEEKLSPAEGKLADIETQFSALENKYDTLISELDIYREKAQNLINSSNVSSSDKAALREIVREIDSYEPDIERFNQQIENSKAQISDGKAQISEGKEQLQGYKDQLNEGKEMLANFDLNEMQVNIDKASQEISKYNEMLDGPSFFSFMMIDLGFGKFEYQGETSTITEYIDNLFVTADTYLNDLSVALNSDIKALLEDVNKQLDEADKALNENKDKVEEQVNNFLATTDEIYAKIDEANSNLDELINKFEEIKSFVDGF